MIPRRIPVQIAQQTDRLPHGGALDFRSADKRRSAGSRSRALSFPGLTIPWMSSVISSLSFSLCSFNEPKFAVFLPVWGVGLFEFGDESFCHFFTSMPNVPVASHVESGCSQHPVKLPGHRALIAIAPPQRLLSSLTGDR
jgi:hypothetical protein